MQRYKKWKDSKGQTFIPVSIDGIHLLNDRILNKGTAFSQEERKALHLEGLLPPHVKTLEEQIDRVYEGYCQETTNIDRYVFLRALQDRNETLFYALVSKHIEDMAPIIYTPTVGQAVQEFSHRFTKHRGLYITPDNVENMGQMLQHFPSHNIRIIVATDSQGILGIGDQGVGGMGIAIGKLALYTLGAGIHPASCLPITLDIGTDNEDLLADPMYLGLKQKRITGSAYEEFIEKFVQQVQKHLPDAILQWEDFSKENAFNNWTKYQERHPSFNDDIQGTGSVVLAGLINAVKIKKETLADQTYVVYGAGAGGVGVANQIHAALLREGVDAQTAYDKIFILDSRGIVFDNRPNLEDYKKSYAKPVEMSANWKLEEAGKATLTETLENLPVTTLIGTCGVYNSFKEEHVKAMLNVTDRPIVFPLSNPTSNCEATPEDLYKWSDGQAIVATGSPFAPVTLNGREFRIGQGNNVFIFPGVGMAAILANAKRIDNNLFTVASYALADCVAQEDLDKGTVYPRFNCLEAASQKVAIEVIKEIIKDQPDHPLQQVDLEEYLPQVSWKAEYLSYRRA